MDRPGEGGDVDAFELGAGGDGMDVGDGGGGMEEFGDGGSEVDLNLNDDLAPDMQVCLCVGPPRLLYTTVRCCCSWYALSFSFCSACGRDVDK